MHSTINEACHPFDVQRSECAVDQLAYLALLITMYYSAGSDPDHDSRGIGYGLEEQRKHSKKSQMYGRLLEDPLRLPILLTDRVPEQTEGSTKFPFMHNKLSSINPQRYKRVGLDLLQKIVEPFRRKHLCTMSDRKLKGYMSLTRQLRTRGDTTLKMATLRLVLLHLHPSDGLNESIHSQTEGVASRPSSYASAASTAKITEVCRVLEATMARTKNCRK